MVRRRGCRRGSGRYNSPSMISVIIPTLNAERTLGPTLAALVPAVVDGLVQEAILVDGGSSDETCLIADAAGAHLITAPRGRGTQLDAGAAAARGDWLLFLHADTVLEPSWAEEAKNFIERVVSLRCFLFALPYGDQGLLISRQLYDRLGGFRPIPLMEDVDLVRRLKRSEIAILASRAVTSGARYRREGYLARSLRNLGLMLLYYLRVPPRVLVRLYG